MPMTCRNQTAWSATFLKSSENPPDRKILKQKKNRRNKSNDSSSYEIKSAAIHNKICDFILVERALIWPQRVAQARRLLWQALAHQSCAYDFATAADTPA